MRTVLASALAVAASQTIAHEGHGQAGFHWHGGDLLSLPTVAVGVGLWLWRRGQR